MWITIDNPNRMHKNEGFIAKEKTKKKKTVMNKKSEKSSKLA